MRYSGVAALLQDGRALLAKGPVALIFVEDEIETDSTLRHHLDLGFQAVIAFMPPSFGLAPDVAERIVRVDHDLKREAGHVDVVNRAIAAAPGMWFYFGFNAEYLFFPFCETRTVSELLRFHAEERREAMLCYVIDIYAGDLTRHPTAVSVENAYLDRSGYYALARPDPANHNHPRERQLDFFGGLRWRFEEHVPPNRRKIDRISLFMARTGVTLRDDHTFTDEEYNTYACPWHNNLTAAVVSFRTAKALKANPGSSFDIHDFRWHNSTPFEWHSRQLLDLGLMEPGQWF